MRLSVFYEHIAEAAKQTGKPVSEICDIVHGFGIDGVEIGIDRIIEDEELIKQLAQSRLTVNCVYGFFDFGHNSDYNEGLHLIDTAVRIGAKKVLVIPGFVRENDDLHFSLQNMRQAVSKICEYAGNRGIVVGMEDFDDASAPFAAADQLLWFMENVPGLKCTFDTGNFLYSEEDVLIALHKLGEYIDHVHCKDRSFDFKQGEEPKLTVKGRKLYSSAVGFGCIPMKEIVEYLIAHGYDGGFAIEHFGSVNQLEDMEKSARWLLDLKRDM